MAINRKISILSTAAYHNEAIIAVKPYRGINKKFIFLFLPNRALAGESKAAIMGKTLNSSSLAKVLIPTPPKQEQHRIVAKVDELMALCDQLEQQTETSITAHQTLVETLLNALTQSTSTAPSPTAQHDSDQVTTHNTFEQAWQRIAEHFDTLFTTEHSIELLKQSILQLAVMGKLVPQDPNDEPASELLRRIAAEKAELMKAKKIKKQKALPEVGEEEKPFELPVGWEWCRFGELAKNSDAGWSPKCEPQPRIEPSWGVLKVSAVSWGKYNPNENKKLPSDLNPRKEFEVKAGDFLISRANTAELVAKAVVVPNSCPSKLMMSDKIIRFEFTSDVDTVFISIVNDSAHSRSYYAAAAGGTSSSMKNVSREQIRNLNFCLPPLEEQHRIVAKVDKLTTLCDLLKSRLSDAQNTKLQLADAVTEQAIR